MKTAKFLIVTLALLIASGGVAEAQFGKKLGDALKKTAESTTIKKAEQKTDQAISKSIDKATDANTYKGGENGSGDNATGNVNTGDSNEAQPAAASQPAQTPSAAPAADSPKAAEMAYAKSDFVPGDEIIFEDLMDNEQLGEFPSMWDLLKGVAEVASINGKKAIIFPEEWTEILPLMKNNTYLPEKYTIEMDLWLTKIYDGKKESQQEYRFQFYQNEDAYSKVLQLDINNYDFYTQSEMTWGYKSTSGQDVSGQGKILLETDGWHHLSISFNQRAFKVYLDGVRIANIPNMSQAGRFTITRGWDYTSSAITNVRIAKGAVPLYDRMMSDGKFITYGITFDVGKSTIKPESMSEINRIVTLMTENPDLKFSVEGHTDNTGNTANNQTLSEARSKAIVDKLVSLGIAANRLTSAGKGQNSPISDNSTDEGRAKNRRVEFVKQ